ncbi:MAG: hypothetical protein WA622_26970 [Mycobacterium sp.]|uniref:hypothetical protein n=1 Tax=Mycobacterium sp. TaxID=1785 RepID=UPI003CB54803
MVVSGFVVVKAALTWVVLNTWASYPKRPGVHHWHIELGPLAEWLAAAAAAGAAITALYIAGRDRKQRSAERHDEEKTQARLVRMEVSQWHNKPVVTVQVRNFGSLPILDIELSDATWSQHPDARWVTNWGMNTWPKTEPAQVGLHRPILKPHIELDDRAFDRLVEYEICFIHHAEDRPLRPKVTTGPAANYLVPNYVPTDLSTVVAKIRFTTANGVRWETPTNGAGSGEPVRL